MKHPPERAMNAVAVNHVLNHPQYEVIISSLREGIKITEIARYFSEQQLLVNVSEKTFLEYLYTFRRLRWRDISKQDLDDEAQGIKRYVSAHQPEINIDNEIDRAIRFQQLRLGLGFNHEKGIGLPMEQTTKDVIGLGKLLELKAKTKGLQSLTKAVRDGMSNTTATARDELTRVQTDEADQEKLFRLAQELVTAR